MTKRGRKPFICGYCRQGLDYILLPVKSTVYKWKFCDIECFLKYKSDEEKKDNLKISTREQ